jgi:hypothetical protein
MRDIREKFGAEVKPFDPSFIIPRHIPGWETMEGAEAQGMVFKPARSVAPEAPAGRKALAIEIKRRA